MFLIYLGIDRTMHAMGISDPVSVGYAIIIIISTS